MTVESPALTPIVVIEDEPANRALIRAIIAKTEARGMGRFELHEASNLADGRRVLAAHRARLLLLDVRLSDGSGLDIAWEVRAAAVMDRPWVVAMSASVHAEDQQRALRAGADLFLEKPFRAEQLGTILSRAARG